MHPLFLLQQVASTARVNNLNTPHDQVGFFPLMLLGHGQMCYKHRSVSLVSQLEKRTKITLGMTVAPSLYASKYVFKQSCLHPCFKHQQTGPTASQANPSAWTQPGWLRKPNFCESVPLSVGGGFGNCCYKSHGRSHISQA